MPTTAPMRDDPGLSLALAMVVSSTAPLLLLDGDQRITAVSASFCSTFDIDCATAAGHRLSELGQGEWDVRQLAMLMDATISGDATIEAYEMDLHRPGRPSRSLVLNLQKLNYGAPNTQVRLLLTVNDVTEARKIARQDRETQAKNEDLERDNQVLLQEIRHRVANSLQIIASVMMQNARRSQSEETRSHLRDAHNRVMSVAELQQQLAVSTHGTVSLRVYLTKLCATIGASMIADPQRLALTVEAEDATVDAGVSVSIGLIVTELVINALKHAFPDDREGKITVRYDSEGPAWTLSVSDDGVGMPSATATAATTAGLGTSIVQALARQLRAEVVVVATNPGVRVSVVHVQGGKTKPHPDLSQPEAAV